MVAQKWAHGDIPSALRPPPCQAGCMTRGQEVVNDRCPPPHHCGRRWHRGICERSEDSVLVQPWNGHLQLAVLGLVAEAFGRH